MLIDINGSFSTDKMQKKLGTYYDSLIETDESKSRFLEKLRSSTNTLDDDRCLLFR
jgi:hypothetical protein